MGAKALQTVDYNKLGPREVRVLDIWGRGFTKIPDIVREYNATFATQDKVAKVRAVDVAQVIKKIKRIVMEQTVDDFRDIVMEETMQLYREAKDSWLESKQDLVIVTETRMEGEKGWSDSTSEKRQAQTGNPAHWNNALKALSEIKLLLGLNSPKNMEEIIREEMSLVLAYMEDGLDAKTYDKVQKLLANYHGGQVVDSDKVEVLEDEN